MIDFDKAILMDNENSEAWAKKGFTLLSSGHYTDAITAYDSALKLNPDDIHTLVDKGLALSALNQYEDAIFYSIPPWRENRVTFRP